MTITRQERRILFLCSLLSILLVNTFAFAPQISNDLISNSISSEGKDIPTDKEFDNLLSADYSDTYNKIFFAETVFYQYSGDLFTVRENIIWPSCRNIKRFLITVFEQTVFNTN